MSADTALSTVSSPDFDNVISDPDGAYTAGFLTGFYTLPASGLYIFQAEFVLDITWDGIFPTEITIQNFFVPSGLFDFQLVERILYNTNAAPGRAATIRYRWTQTYAYQGITGNGVYLNNAALSLPAGVTGEWKQETNWRAAGVIVNNAVPVIRDTEYPITVSDFNTITSDITKPLLLEGVMSYVSEIRFSPFGVSAITTELNR